MEIAIKNQRARRHTVEFLLAWMMACAAGMFAGAFIATNAARAATATNATVEFPVWSRAWSGTLGRKSIQLSLTREADTLSGYYCYAPCSDANRLRLWLRGAVNAQGAALTEVDTGAKTPDQATGYWKMASLDNSAQGTWTSPDGRRALPIVLTQTRTQTATAGATEKPFPYDIRLVATGLPNGNGNCNDVPHVTAIRLYAQDRLAQELPTDSQGACDIFLPEVVDANFDGWPDLRILLAQGAGPNEAYQTWLFDPQTQRFVDAPRSLQDIPSAEYDPAHQIVWSAERVSCCEHDLTTYRWQAGELKQVDFQTSYVLPVLDGTTRYYCASAPDYADGVIYFPYRVEQAGDKLTLTFKDFSWCDKDLGMPDQAAVFVWQANAGYPPTKLLRTEGMTWARAETSAGTRFCPNVPFFDRSAGEIRRIVLNGDPEMCLDADPRQQ